MSARRVVTRLLALGVVALGGACAGAGAAEVAGAPATVPATTDVAPPTPPSTTPPATSDAPATTMAAPAPSTTSSSTSTSTSTSTTAPVPVPTMAPIVTHDARVGTGVLVGEDVAEPRRLVIASIGVDEAIVPTGVDDKGELAIPDDARELVWWQHGPTPGLPGSAVIAGHVDWKGVLGTFDRLGEVPVGDRIEVTDDTGRVMAFVVTSVEIVDKAAVSVNGTFDREGQPILRLVTCGGEYDSTAHRYRTNVVVTAVPA